MLGSTIVHRNVLVKILRKLELILEEEFVDGFKDKEHEKKFLMIIKALNERKINEVEFFEEDEIVKKLVKRLFTKLIRNFSGDNNNKVEVSMKLVDLPRD